jgi:beta-xylosidase
MQPVVPSRSSRPSLLLWGFCLAGFVACSSEKPSGTSTPGSGGSSSKGTGGSGPGTGGSGTGGALAGGSPGGGGGGVATGGRLAAGGSADGGARTTGGAVASGGRSSGGSIETGGTSSGGVGPTGGVGAGGAVQRDGGAADAAVGTGGTTSLSDAGGSATGGQTGSATCATTYTNPIIWEDLPDNEVIRVDDVYYLSASSFHYSPGAPILRSWDLVHWEYLTHSVPALDYNNSYSLIGGRNYNNGVWASSLQYRKSDKTFYWLGCMHNSGGSYLYKATAIEGPWTKQTTSNCYYDVGLLIDDDDTMYVAYGNSTLSVAQLSADGTKQVKNQVVLESPSDIGPLEGSRFNRINGDYYIFTTQYANGEYVLRSTTGPFGPYTLKKFAVKLPYAGAAGSGSAPHQGSVIQTQNGDWYYMGFNDSYPVGRIPVMAPVTWTDGWPSVTLVNGQWAGSYPFPKLPCGAGKVKPLIGTDNFSTESLAPQWSWNHNPDSTKWSTGSGLTLQTATVTDDLFSARNTLVRRTVGPTSTATIQLDYSAMKDGDVAGLVAFRDSSAWIGIKKTAADTKVAMVKDVKMDTTWKTTNKGTEVASAPVSGGSIWLRMLANVRTDSGGANVHFQYSTNGTQFTDLGTSFALNKDWQFFMGYRYGIFNYATTALGGSIKVASFSLTTP